MNVPTNAPTIPNRIVMMIPPGSLPGMTSLASAPTMSPIMMVQRIDMVASHRVEGLYDREQHKLDEQALPFSLARQDSTSRPHHCACPTIDNGGCPSLDHATSMRRPCQCCRCCSASPFRLPRPRLPRARR